MRKNWPVILFIILFIISVGGFTRYIGVMKEKVEAQETIIAEKNGEIERVRLDNGKYIDQKNRAIADRKTLETSYNFLLDSLEEMGIKYKNVKSLLFLAKQTKGSGTGKLDTIIQVVNVKDTVKAVYEMNINEPYFTFNSIIKSDYNFTYDYVTFDSLAVVNTTKRNWFKPNEHKVNVYNSNPKSQINGLTSLTIQEKKVFLEIVAVAGYGITEQGTGPFLGIGVGKPIIRFYHK